MKTRTKLVSRIMLAGFFVVAGLGHFVNPQFYMSIVPDALPHPLALVYISGFFEILGGVGVLIPPVRRAAGWGLIALLIAVFPANIKMFDDHLHEGWNGMTVGLALRLPLQIAFIVIVDRLTRKDRLSN